VTYTAPVELSLDRRHHPSTTHDQTVRAPVSGQLLVQPGLYPSVTANKHPPPHPSPAGKKAAA
jgi:hypothetical protein